MPSKLPQQLTLDQTQNQWAAILDPIATNPLVQGIILKNVSLQTGANVINHKLGRALQGWYTTRINAAATIYDTQSTNQMPQLTLNLTASAPVTIDLAVF